MRTTDDIIVSGSPCDDGIQPPQDAIVGSEHLRSLQKVVAMKSDSNVTTFGGGGPFTDRTVAERAQMVGSEHGILL